MDEGDHWSSYYPYYLAIILLFVTVAIAVLLTKVIQKSRLAKLRELWDGREKDVVTLHMFPRARTGPNASPYPTKLEAYFKVMDIK